MGDSLKCLYEFDMWKRMFGAFGTGRKNVGCKERAEFGAFGTSQKCFYDVHVWKRTFGAFGT